MPGITTTVVGSYPQPAWLVDRERFKGNVVPRIRLPEVWRVPAPLLEEAQDDAVRVAVGDMERAGIDVLSDGEQRRESYFNRFANALGGLDPERHGSAARSIGVRSRGPRSRSRGPRSTKAGSRQKRFIGCSARNERSKVCSRVQRRTSY